MYADDCQVYLNTSVEDVPLAVNKFAACVADINAWLSACRLQLNAAKTQLLWLGSSQLVDRVDCHDLVVVIDRELSQAAHVTASVRPSTPFSANTDTPIFCCQPMPIPMRYRYASRADVAQRD